MSDCAQNDPLSRYLMYKVAVRCNDIKSAAECLKVISDASPNDPTLLYACCLDAQQVGHREQTLAALQLVYENYEHKPSAALHLPSLIRLTIGLMDSILKNNADSEDHEATVERMCTAFEKASAALQRSRNHGKMDDETWSIDELDWFSKNAYNIAIKNLSSWNPRRSLRMLTCCIAFIDCYPPDIGQAMSEDLSLRKMFCQFSAATALVTLARGEDNIEIQLQDYLTLRKHVDGFDKLLQTKLEKVDVDQDQDLRRKLSILAAFDFEAVCRLKAWDSLPEAILKTEVCRSSQIYEVMADCILCSQAPIHGLGSLTLCCCFLTPILVMVDTLKKIVNEAWSLESFDITKLAQYMRCLFQATISGHTQLAEQLLGQIAQNASQAAEVSWSCKEKLVCDKDAQH
jgi:hypothetical protein